MYVKRNTLAVEQNLQNYLSISETITLKSGQRWQKQPNCKATPQPFPACLGPSTNATIRWKMSFEVTWASAIRHQPPLEFIAQVTVSSWPHKHAFSLLPLLVILGLPACQPETILRFSSLSQALRFRSISSRHR